MSDAPMVYVGTYAKYNAGSIAGKWLDLEDYTDKESFIEACRELHKDESDPELMFQDYSGFPEEYYGESHLADDLWDWLDLNDEDREMLARYQDATGNAASIEDAQDAFSGTADSEADFAANLAEETGAVPNNFPSWISIDWQHTWDGALRFDYITSRAEDGTLWFFNRY
ncbi:antirestriction protein ArdA [Methyloceanibacter caenitepidi]|uniref:Antirestriction protein ArdA n=1 Tax=Methyloceanibacter caenitepidi TaxID=1384459 RepID=A0A0A8JZ52_9HYPH|nr:antirestriction protein ArdA [Methyloceanibacter caenitepidi]BAQ16088.1 antirestriction protein ArdA [Methyloceanibacter caenitepidi]